MQKGDAEIRAQGRKLKSPGGQVKLAPSLLDSYAGKYALPNGRVIEITRKEGMLWAKVASDELGFVPLDPVNFYGEKFNVWVTFEKDASGAVTGLVGHQPGDGDFEAKRQ